MFLVNGMRATLRQFNRTNNDSVFDDQNYKDVPIMCCPYDVEQAIRYGIYTVPEAKGYYQVPRWVDVRQGDQIIFHGKRIKDKNFQEQTHTVLEVQEGWLFNSVENKIAVVK